MYNEPCILCDSEEAHFDFIQPILGKFVMEGFFCDWCLQEAEDQEVVYSPSKLK